MHYVGRFSRESEAAFLRVEKFVEKEVKGGNSAVAIFRFAKAHINDAIEAFRALASASRQESGNLRYDLYRGIDDDLEFYVVWSIGPHQRL